MIIDVDTATNDVYDLAVQKQKNLQTAIITVSTTGWAPVLDGVGTTYSKVVDFAPQYPDQSQTLFAEPLYVLQYTITDGDITNYNVCKNAEVRIASLSLVTDSTTHYTATIYATSIPSSEIQLTLLIYGKNVEPGDPANESIEDFIRDSAICAWSNTTLYHLDDVCYYNGDIYKCIQENTGQVPAVSQNYWIIGVYGLIYNDVSVTFVPYESEYSADWPMRAEIGVSGTTANTYATATFANAEATSGNYAPFCETGEDRVYLYSKVAGTITIPSITIRSVPLSSFTIYWDDITGKPTTIEGYGITDAYTIDQVDEIIAAHTERTDNPHEVTKAQVGLGNVVNAGMDNIPTANSNNYVKSGGVYDAIEPVEENLFTHIEDNSNPHNVSKSQVGLGDVVNAPMDNAPTQNSNNYVKSGGAYSAIQTVQADIDSHEASTNNPHSVTKSQVGLGSVENRGLDITPTSGSNKYVTSGGVYSAIATVQSDIDTHEANTSNPHSVTKAQVGLGACDNTSDLAKPISTATQNALNNKVDKTTTVNGHALSANVVVTKADVGLGNCNNTSDLAKPISTATQSALDAKLDDTQLISSWQNTPDNQHIPSEALVKGNLDSVNSAVNTINSKIPSAASSSNQLADKGFVNSSISTNTANFLGTYGAVSDLGFTQATVDGWTDPPTSTVETNVGSAISSTLSSQHVTTSSNDYVFVSVNKSTTLDVDWYWRFKYDGANWLYEYTLNNSSYTQAQWDAINSGITSAKVSSYDSHIGNTSNPHSVTKSQVGLGSVVDRGLDTNPTSGSNKYVTSGGVYTAIQTVQTNLNTHTANTSNPHSVTKSQVGLGNVVNAGMDNAPTANSNNYVKSGGAYTAIQAVQSDIDTHESNTSNPHSVTKSQVGLGSVVNVGMDNTPTQNSNNYVKSGGVYTALDNKVDKLSTSPAGNNYTKVNVNAQGQVTGHSSLAESDIPSLSISKTTGLQAALDAKITSTGTMTSGNVVLSNGGTVIKDSGYTIGKSVPSNAVFTDVNVTQTLKTDNYDRPLLMSDQIITTTTVDTTGATRRNNSMYANTSTGIITANGFNGAQVGGLTKTYTTGANTTRVILARVNNYTGLASCRIKLEVGPNTSSGAKVVYIDAVWAGRGARMTIESVYDWNNAVRYFFITCPNNTSYYTSYPPEIHIQQNSAVARTIKATILERSGEVVLMDNLTTAGNTTNRNNSTYDVNNTIGIYDNTGYVQNSGWASGAWDRLDNDRYLYGEACVNTSLVARASDGKVWKLSHNDKEFLLPLDIGSCTGTFAVNANWGRVCRSIRGLGWANFTNTTTQSTAFTVPTLTVSDYGKTVYLVGTLSNGNFKSNRTISLSMDVPSSGSLTYVPIGKIDHMSENVASAVPTSWTLDTYNANAYTIDSSGKLTHINGKEIKNPVASVNGKTGAVVLAASDVGAQPAGTYLTLYNSATNKSSIATWGTLTAANGYTHLAGTQQSVGGTNGELTIASKSGQTSMQVDGFFYQNEGSKKVLDESIVETTLANDAKLPTGAAVTTAISGKIDTAGTGLSKSGTKLNHSNSINAGTVGTSSATSGSSLAVPYVTYDAQGHITATGTHTHTVNGFLASNTTFATINGTSVKSGTAFTLQKPITLSSSDPSGGSDGDIWIQY